MQFTAYFDHKVCYDGLLGNSLARKTENLYRHLHFSGKLRALTLNIFPKCSALSQVRRRDRDYIFFLKNFFLLQHSYFMQFARIKKNNRERSTGVTRFIAFVISIFPFFDIIELRMPEAVSVVSFGLFLFFSRYYILDVFNTTSYL